MTGIHKIHVWIKPTFEEIQELDFSLLNIWNLYIIIYNENYNSITHVTILKLREKYSAPQKCTINSQRRIGHIVLTEIVRYLIYNPKEIWLFISTHEEKKFILKKVRTCYHSFQINTSTNLFMLIYVICFFATSLIDANSLLLTRSAELLIINNLHLLLKLFFY